MTIIAINIFLWVVGSGLYFTGAISGTQAMIVGIVVQVSLPILVKAIRFFRVYGPFFLEPRPFYPGYRP